MGKCCFYCYLQYIDIQRNRLLIGHSWQGGHCIIAMALHVGANQYNGLAYSAKVCFIAVGDNYLCKQDQQGTKRAKARRGR